SVIVELVATSPSDQHTFKLQYAASADGLLINPVDSTRRFADVTYDPERNQLSDSVASANRVVVRHLLTDADTAGRTLVLHLPTPLNVGAGEKVVAYIHFKS